MIRRRRSISIRLWPTRRRRRLLRERRPSAEVAQKIWPHRPPTLSLSLSFGLTQCRREEGTRSPTWKRSWRNVPGRWNSSTSRWAGSAASSLHAVNAVRHRPSRECPLAFHQRALAPVERAEACPRQGAPAAGRAVNRSARVEGVHSPVEAHIHREADHPPDARSRPMIFFTRRCAADLSRNRCRLTVD